MVRIVVLATIATAIANAESREALAQLSPDPPICCRCGVEFDCVP